MSCVAITREPIPGGDVLLLSDSETALSILRGERREEREEREREGGRETGERKERSNT